MTLQEVLELDEGACPGCPVCRTPQPRPTLGGSPRAERPATCPGGILPGIPNPDRRGGGQGATHPRKGITVSANSYKKDARRLGKRKARADKLARIKHRRLFRFREKRRRGIFYVR